MLGYEKINPAPPSVGVLNSITIAKESVLAGPDPAKANLRKETNSMTYEKPKIVPLGPAAESIQNNNLKGIGVLDAQTPRRPTNGAYHADE